MRYTEFLAGRKEIELACISRRSVERKFFIGITQPKDPSANIEFTNTKRKHESDDLNPSTSAFHSLLTHGFAFWTSFDALHFTLCRLAIPSFS